MIITRRFETPDNLFVIPIYPLFYSISFFFTPLNLLSSLQLQTTLQLLTSPFSPLFLFYIFLYLVPPFYYFLFPSVLILDTPLVFYSNTNHYNSMFPPISIHFYISYIALFFLTIPTFPYLFVLLVTNLSTILYLYNLYMLLFLKILSSLQLQTSLPYFFLRNPLLTYTIYYFLYLP